MRLLWSSDLPSEESRLQWNELVSALERPEIFYTWEWAEAARAAFHASMEPRIATAHEGKRLVGVVALARISSHEITFLASTTADYCDFISLPERKNDFVEEVLRSLKAQGIRKITLANLPAESSTAPCIRDSKIFHSFFRTGYQCSSIRLGIEENRASLSRSLTSNKTYRKSLKAWEKEGDVRFEHRSIADEKALEELFLMHVCRFLRTGRISNLVTPQRRSFLVELARLLGRSQWFDLMSLKIGDQIAASHLGFRFASSWFWYLPTINNDFEKHSPGHSLLTRFATEACDDPNAQRVDLGLGDEGYKERFANDHRRTLHVTLSRELTGHLITKGRQYAVAATKHRPKLESVARSGRDWIGALQHKLQNGLLPTLHWYAGRMQRRVAHTEEVAFFQWPAHAGRSESDGQIIPLTWNILGKGAIDHWDDPETLQYLIRTSERLQSRLQSGYALVSPDAEPQHFAWVAPVHDFPDSGLGMEASADPRMLIFDCWTPRKLRGRGYFKRAIEQLAIQLSEGGCEVWISTEANNQPSLAGIQQTAFRPRYSLIRRTVLGRSRLSRLACENGHDGSTPLCSAESLNQPEEWSPAPR